MGAAGMAMDRFIGFTGRGEGIAAQAAASLLFGPAT